MKRDKEFIFEAIGYGIIIAYWILGTIFCTIMLVMHWSDYLIVGETINHMSLPVLILCTTVAVPLAWIMTGFGTYMYIHNLKMYSK